MPGDDAQFSSVPIRQPEFDWNAKIWVKSLVHSRKYVNHC